MALEQVLDSSSVRRPQITEEQFPDLANQLVSEITPSRGGGTKQKESVPSAFSFFWKLQDRTFDIIYYFAGLLRESYVVNNGFISGTVPVYWVIESAKNDGIVISDDDISVLIGDGIRICDNLDRRGFPSNGSSALDSVKHGYLRLSAGHDYLFWESELFFGQHAKRTARTPA